MPKSKNDAPDGHALCIDLTTPRQYTAHGNWNQGCECGLPFGDDLAEVEMRYADQLAELDRGVIERDK